MSGIYLFVVDFIFPPMFLCFRLFNCAWGALLCSLVGSINRISNLLAVLKYNADVNLGFGWIGFQGFLASLHCILCGATMSGQCLCTAHALQGTVALGQAWQFCVGW